MKLEIMKKIFLTVIMALAMANANASALNLADVAMKNINHATLVTDSTFYKMNLNDKINNMKRSFNLDEYQTEYLETVQLAVERGFNHMNVIKDDKTREKYFKNLIGYWRRESRNAFSNTPKLEWKESYRRYWACVNQTLINMHYINYDND
jgi:uncharacterized protein YydD (DUF2326 family)